MPNMTTLSLIVQKLKRRLKLTTDRQGKTICLRSFNSGAYNSILGGGGGDQNYTSLTIIPPCDVVL